MSANFDNTHFPPCPCHCTKQELLNARLTVLQECPLCLKKHGQKIIVADHPNGNQLLNLYKLFITILI